MMEERKATAITAIAEEQAHLLARVSNDHLLKLREAIARLQTNLDSSFWYSFEHKSTVRTERDSLLAEVKVFKNVIEEEYAIRLFRGYRSELQKLLAELSPQAHAVKGQLTPINAEVAAQWHEGQPQDALQEAAHLVERLRTLLDSEASGGSISARMYRDARPARSSICRTARPSWTETPARPSLPTY